MLFVAQVIAASKPEWIAPFTGLSLVSSQIGAAGREAGWG
jgi:hypothetical protein